MARKHEVFVSGKALLFLIAAVSVMGLVFMAGCTQGDGGAQPPAAGSNGTVVTTPEVPSGLANETPTLPILNQSNETSLNQTAPGENASQNYSDGNSTGGETLPILPGEGGTSTPYAAYKSNDTLISTSNFSIPFEPFKPLDIYVINVGYGEAILLKKGEFEMLVDSGPAASFPYLDTFLKKLNIKKIEAVVATRGRADYIGAMPQLLDNYEVEDFWHNNVTSTIPEYAAMMSKVKEKGLLVKLPNSGDVMDVNGMQVRVLNPFSPRIGNTDSDESDSIVLKVIDKDFCAMLMSDAETGTENRIMGAFSDLNCQAIHIGHNGAGTATQGSTLLARVNPKVAIISVGANTDNNPKTTVLELLRLNGIQTLRTDKDGNVLVESDGTRANYTVRTKQ
ncbi:MAG: hypothetical protein WC506_03850 [Candidatus Micrarchaeia archaeon]